MRLLSILIALVVSISVISVICGLEQGESSPSETSVTIDDIASVSAPAIENTLNIASKHKDNEFIENHEEGNNELSGGSEEISDSAAANTEEEGSEIRNRLLMTNIDEGIVTAPRDLSENEKSQQVKIDNKLKADVEEARHGGLLNKDVITNDEDDAMREILAMQRDEEDTEQEQLAMEERDRLTAAEAEAKASEIERFEREEKEKVHAKEKEELEWVKRSRPGSEAKPGARIDSKKSASQDLHDSSAYHRRERRVPDTVSEKGGRGGGSYFSTDNANINAESEMRRQEAMRKARERDRLSSGGGDMRRKLENMLSSELREKVTLAQQKKEHYILVYATNLARFRTPRKYARPVEQAIIRYDDENCDLYTLLGVSRGVSDVQLKKAYRSIALLLHPDKNPHPDSKAAFDHVQEAYVTLSNAASRAAYDESLQLKRRRSLSLTVMLRSMTHFLGDTRARVQQFVSRVATEEGRREEYAELVGERIEKLRNAFLMHLHRIVLAPTLIDRISLVTELHIDNLRKILLVSLLAASTLQH